MTKPINYYHPMSLLSIKDTCAYLSTSRANLYRLLQAGKLEAIKMGRNTRIPYASIETYIHSLPKLYDHSHSSTHRKGM